MNIYDYSIYIDGKWTGDNLEKSSVQDPATGEIVGTVPRAGEKETKLAIDAASKALNSWRNKTANERANYLRTFFNLMHENKQELAELMTREMGRPLPGTLGEVDYAASFIEWFAEEAKRIYGWTAPGKEEDHRIRVQKNPVGVVAAITPWNFPASMLTRKLGPALAAGCTFIAKPASKTPLSALRLAELAEEAGIPNGVFNVVPGDSKAFTTTIMKDMRVRKVSFTGSTPVGREIMEGSAAQIKKVSLELGGHAPFIICDDADIDKAVSAVIASKFRNSGQTCVATNRVLVQDNISDLFSKRLATEMEKLTYGNGLKNNVDVGPLVNKSSYEKVDGQIQDALQKGAEILVGGQANVDEKKNTYFFEPTLMSNMSSDMTMMYEETFGPIAPIQIFHSDQEAVEIANDTPYGLAAYFYTKDMSRGERIAEGLEYGIVGWNDGLPSAAQAPFGGVKQSGLGREGSHEGIEEYLETKYVSVRI